MCVLDVFTPRTINRRKYLEKCEPRVRKLLNFQKQFNIQIFLYEVPNFLK